MLVNVGKMLVWRWLEAEVVFDFVMGAIGVLTGCGVKDAGQLSF